MRWTSKQDAIAFSQKMGMPIDKNDKHIPCGHWHKVADLLAPVGKIYFHDVLNPYPSIVEFYNMTQTRRLALNSLDVTYGACAGIDDVKGRGYWKVQNYIIAEIDLATMTVLRRISTTDIVLGVQVDQKNQLLYYNTRNNPAGNKGRLWKINLSDGLEVGYCDSGSNNNWLVLGPIKIDLLNNKMYGSLAFTDMLLARYNLTAFTYQDSISLFSYGSCAHAVRPEIGLVFSGNNSNAPKFWRITMSPFAVADSVLPEPDSAIIPRSVNYDSIGEYAYFGPYANPCMIYKWHRTGGAVTTLAFNSDGSYSGWDSLVVDEKERKLYFGLHCAGTGKPRLVIVDLDLFTVLDTFYRDDVAKRGPLHCGLYYESKTSGANLISDEPQVWSLP